VADGLGAGAADVLRGFEESRFPHAAGENLRASAAARRRVRPHALPELRRHHGRLEDGLTSHRRGEVPSRPWPEVRDELLARDAARMHAHLRQIPRCADVVVTALDLDVTSKTAVTATAEQWAAMQRNRAATAASTRRRAWGGNDAESAARCHATRGASTASGCQPAFWSARSFRRTACGNSTRSNCDASNR
jgi:hypothetical protein